MEQEIITPEDIWKEITKLYVELGNKLAEFDRLMRKKK